MIDLTLPIRRKRGKRKVEVLRTDVRPYGSKTSDYILTRIRYPKFDLIETVSYSQLCKECENDVRVYACPVNIVDGVTTIDFDRRVVMGDGDQLEIVATAKSAKVTVIPK